MRDRKTNNQNLFFYHDQQGKVHELILTPNPAFQCDEAPPNTATESQPDTNSLKR